MKAALRLVTGFLCLIMALPVQAGTIAISIPLSGDAAELGQSFRAGVKLAQETLSIGHDVFIADDGCDADLAKLAANDIANSKPDIVIGLLCNDPAKVIATQLVSTGIPLLVSGARSVRLIKDRERESWNIWRLAPGDDYPVKVAARAISAYWQETPFAVVDDGTIYGRSFTDLLRQELQEIGLEPQFSDTFRAAQSTQAGLLRRLNRSGVTAAFIASATTEDLVTIARNAEEFDIKLDIITTEALGVLPFLEEASSVAPGLKVVHSPPPRDTEFETLLQNLEITPGLYVYLGYSAAQIANEALSAGLDDPTSALSDGEFNTVLGPVRFNPDGSSSYSPYKLGIWDGTNFQTPEDG